MGVAFINQLAWHGASSAFIFADGTTLSYDVLAQRVAERRHELGPRRQLIFWSAELTEDAIVTYLAALQAGHPIFPLSPCHACFTEQPHDFITRYQPGILAYKDKIQKLGPSDVGQRDKSVYHSDLALLLSTSGSTGETKLVRLSAQNIDANASSIVDYLGLQVSHRSALILPLHYSYGLSVLHAHLAAGASLYLPGSSIMAPDFIANIRDKLCTNLSGVPYSYDLLEQISFRDAALPDLRFMTVAGGRLSEDMVRIYAQYMAAKSGSFFVMYGQTEATARMAYLPPKDALAHADCIGQAIPGGAFQLVDRDGCIIDDIDTAGELIYRGSNIMMGYAQSRADLARGSDLDALATGDYAERTSSGYFRLVGRRQRFSKIAGLRIAHDAVEMHVQRKGIPVAVTGDDRQLFIAVFSRDDVYLARDYAQQLTRLPSTCLRVKAISQLPRHANGKIDYRALMAAFDEATPSIIMESRMAVRAAFADVLAPRNVTMRDSFVTLGGNSLSFIELSLALKSILGPLPQGWENWSINDLALVAQTTSLKRAENKLLSLSCLDTDLALRAGAILLILLHHATLWPIAGGAAVLLTLMGYNLARYHARRLFAGDVIGMLRASMRPVLIYYPLLLILCFISGNFSWQSLLLLGNLAIDGYNTQGSPLVIYWFIEAYVQIIVLTALVFAWPRLASFIAVKPFEFGLCALSGALAIRGLSDVVFDLGEMRYFFTPRLIYLVIIGWCLYFADTWYRKLFTSGAVIAIVVGLMIFEGTLHITIVWVRGLVLLLGAGMLLWTTRLCVPALLGKALTIVAVASFSIYLFHTLPYFVWLSRYDWSTPWRVPVYIVLGLGAGLIAHVLVQRIEGMLRQVLAVFVLRWQRSLNG